VSKDLSNNTKLESPPFPRSTECYRGKMGKGGHCIVRSCSTQKGKKARSSIGGTSFVSIERKKNEFHTRNTARLNQCRSRTTFFQPVERARNMRRVRSNAKNEKNGRSNRILRKGKGKGGGGGRPSRKKNEGGGGKTFQPC